MTKPSQLASGRPWPAEGTSRRRGFFLNGNALAGVWKDRLIARVGPDEGEAALLEPYVRAFDITGRPMKKWVAIEPEGVEDDGQLKDWLERATKFVTTLPKK